MSYRIANSTGFTSVLTPQEDYLSEVLHRVLPNPVEDTLRGTFTYCEKKDKRIQELVKKASVAYTVDSMVRQAVDRYSEMFKSFDFEGGETQVRYLKQRLIQMTLQTGEHWETLFTRIVHEYFKTGNTFVVKRRGGTSTSCLRSLYVDKPYCISGLSLVAAERLGPSRNNKGEFQGWELEGAAKDKIKTVLPGAFKHNTKNALIKLTKSVDDSNILVPGVDIVHIAYKKGADSHYGFGLVLAALEDVSMTRTLEQVVAIMIKKFSNPIIHHKIIRPSSPLAGMQQEINMAYELYRRMAPDGVLITGGNTEIKAIGSESQALRNEGYLHYWLNRSLAGLGVSPYLMGLEGAGQGTVEAAVELLMMKVRFCQAEIAREIEMFIINELLWEGGFDPYTNEADIVKLSFEGVDENRLIKLQTHAADMFTKNLWDFEESRKYGKTKSTANDGSLYFNKVAIPLTKAEAEAKGSAQKDAGVAIAKAKPKKTTKEILDEIQNRLPTNEVELLALINHLEQHYGIDSQILVDLVNDIEPLIGDREAVVLLLQERLQ